MNAKLPSHRVWHFALALALAVGLLFPIQGAVRADTRVINPALPATFAWPSWWSGSIGTNDCNADVYNPYFTGDPDAVLKQTWRGIQTCHPRPLDIGLTGVPFSILKLDGSGQYTPTQYMFQCTELAKRYLRIASGADIITADGKDVATNYASTYPTKFQHFVNNGNAQVYPQEGDVVSMTSSDAGGHVAIVTELYVSDTPGNGYVRLMDQNGSTDGDFRIDIYNYVLQDESIESLGFHPVDWIHPLVGVENSPSTAITTQIDGVAAEHNHSWIVGNEQPIGYDRRQVTWNWNGSSWMKYNPPDINGAYYTDLLHDVVIDANGDVWTVGEHLTYYQGGYRWYTDAFQWNPSTQVWVHKASDNYSLTSSNYLNAIADDGTGNIYAVGYYYASGSYPLMLKWNGTKFENQNVSLPQGVGGGIFTDISFSSPSNGWAVGSIGTLSSGLYVYHFDGSTWSSSQLPANYAIQKVVAVSDTEAWGVGYFYVNPSWASHLYHYTLANGWQEVSYSFPTSTNLRNIDAESPSNVWAVGTYAVGSYGQPYAIRYDGTSWSQVSAQTFTYGGVPRSVAVVDGSTWIAGDRQTTSQSYPRYPIVLVK